MFGTRARASIALMVTMAALTASTPASAEWFVDVYLGGAFTEKHDVDTEFPGGVLSALDVSFNNSFTGGLRGGYWLPFDVGPLNFGLGVDFSHFAPNIGRQSKSNVGRGRQDLPGNRGQNFQVISSLSGAALRLDPAHPAVRLRCGVRPLPVRGQSLPQLLEGR